MKQTISLKTRQIEVLRKTLISSILFFSFSVVFCQGTTDQRAFLINDFHQLVDSFNQSGNVDLNLLEKAYEKQKEKDQSSYQCMYHIRKELPVNMLMNVQMVRWFYEKAENDESIETHFGYTSIKDPLMLRFYFQTDSTKLKYPKQFQRWVMLITEMQLSELEGTKDRLLIDFDDIMRYSSWSNHFYDQPKSQDIFYYVLQGHSHLPACVLGMISINYQRQKEHWDKEVDSNSELAWSLYQFIIKFPDSKYENHHEYFNLTFAQIIRDSGNLNYVTNVLERIQDSSLPIEEKKASTQNIVNLVKQNGDKSDPLYTKIIKSKSF